MASARTTLHAPPYTQRGQSGSRPDPGPSKPNTSDRSRRSKFARFSISSFSSSRLRDRDRDVPSQTPSTDWLNVEAHPSAPPSPSRSAAPLAIVGIACELPSPADRPDNLSYRDFWRFLRSGGEAYSKVPDDRFAADRWKGKGPGRVVTDTGAFVKHPSLFDPLEFGISNKDAPSFPVSARKLLELSFQALTDAGIPYRGRRVGCYVSGVAHDLLSMSDVDEYAVPASFAGVPAMISNKISYHLDLRGPSLALDTACSSSLTAFHLAAQALRQGECEAAVVGGYQFNARLSDWIFYSQSGLLSPDGKCKPFDADANGFSRGEGGCVVVVKPLLDALRDDDRIYATILGTAINNAGLQAPAGVPAADAQEEVARRAYHEAGRSPHEVDFVELHATGTSVGDPVEANMAGRFFSKGRGDRRLLLGSVKGNVGHLEITAFLVSLAKVCLMFEHGTVPPNVNVRRPNNRIRWDDYHMAVPMAPLALPSHSQPERPLVSICSYGIGGSNGHVVLEGPPSRSQASPSSRIFERSPTTCLVVAGGLTSRSSAEVSKAAAVTLQSAPPFLRSAFCMRMARSSRQMIWRSYAVRDSDDGTALDFGPPRQVPKERRPLVFFFSGQGPQHIGMGRELYARYDVFRRTIEELDSYVEQSMGKSLIRDYGLFTTNGTQSDVLPVKGTWPNAVTLPSLTVVQIALFDLLCALSLRPDVVFGHSAGETALAYASGACSKRTAVEIACARAKALVPVERAGGTMAALSCSVRAAQNLIDEVVGSTMDGRRPSVVVAAHNGPEAAAIAGLREPLSAVCRLAQARGISAKVLPTDVAFHSPLVELAKNEYVRLMEEVFRSATELRAPTVRTYSTFTSTVRTASYDAQYFWDNARSPVLFDKTVRHILADLRSEEPPIFVELAPHPALSPYVVALGVAAEDVICPMRRPRLSAQKPETADAVALLGAVGRFFASGFDDVALAACSLDEKESQSWTVVPAPEYPFQRKHVPFHMDHPSFSRRLAPARRPLQGELLRINTETHPILAEHVIKGAPIMPAAGFLETAFQTANATVLWDVEFQEALTLSSDPPATVQVRVQDEHFTIRTSSAGSSAAGSENSFDRTHCQGFASRPSKAIPAPAFLDVAAVRSRCADVVPGRSVYEVGFKGIASFGPHFRRIVECHQGGDELLLRVKGGFADEDAAAGFFLHPSVLDACFQSVLIFVMQHGEMFPDWDQRDFYLPSRAGRVVLHEHNLNRSSGSREPTLWVHARMRGWRPEAIEADVDLYGPDGEPLCSISRCEAARHSGSNVVSVGTRYEPIWQPYCVPKCPGPAGLGTVPAALDSTVLSALDTFSRPEVVLVGGKGPKDLSELEQLLSEAQPYAWELIKSVAARQKTLTSNPSGEFLELFIAYHEQICRESSVLSDVRSAFVAQVHHLIRSGKRAIRVLELGTGAIAGGLTQMLCSSISESGLLDMAVVEYFVCDSSLGRAETAAARASSYPYLRLTVLTDASQCPAAFDILTGFHCLGGRSHRGETLADVDRYLVPGGFLCTVETDGRAWRERRPGTTWYDYAMSRVCPGHLEVHGGQLPLDAGGWSQALRAAGMVDVAVTAAAPAGDANELFVGLVAQLGHPSGNVLDLRPSSSPKSPARSIYFTFKDGNEMQLKEKLAPLASVHQDLSLWILADDGQDGWVARGLSRCLLHEHPGWQVRLVLFDPSWDRQKRSQAVDVLQGVRNLDFELRVDAKGILQVSRLAPSPPPSGQLPFELEPHRLPSVYNPIEVRVAAWSSDGLGFSGTVVSEQGGFTVGERVVGLAHDVAPHASLVVDAGSVTPLPADLSPQGAAALASGLFVGVQGLPCHDDLSRLKTALVHDLDDPTAYVVASFYAALGVRVFGTVKGSAGGARTFATGIPVTDSEDSVVWTSTVRSWAPDGFDIVVLVDRTDRSVLMQSALVCSAGGTIVVASKSAPFSLPPSSSVVENARLINLPQIIRQDPCAVRHNIQRAWSLLEGSGARMDVPAGLDVGSPVDHPVSPEMRFRSKAYYVLIGGVGGLGVHLAVWLYNHGARHIVLTSRSGEASIRRQEHVYARRVLDFLRRQPGIDLRIEAVDAADTQATMALLSSLRLPAAGCFIMPMILADKMFLFQDSSSFRAPFDAKTNALRALAAAIDVSSLDFLVTFSSIAAVVGNPGQSNYAAASTGLEGMTGAYRNAFCIAVPGITDAGGLARLASQSSGNSQLEAWVAAGMTTTQLCRCLEDGLRKLADGPFRSYVPGDLDWGLVCGTVAARLDSARALVKTSFSSVSDRDTSTGERLRRAVASVLMVSEDELDPNTSFRAYGFDSFMAIQLATSIRKMFAVVVSQMQLLGDMTLERLEQLVLSETTEARGPESGVTNETATTKGDTLSDQTLLKFDDRPASAGPPLILVHGSGGAIFNFDRLSRNLAVPLWAICHTADAPISGSIDDLARYYVEAILSARPHGPYRLGSFSATSTLVLVMVRLLEERDEVVEHVVLIDHAPTLLASPAYEDMWHLPDGIEGEAGREAMFRSVLSLLEIDGTEEREGLKDLREILQLSLSTTTNGKGHASALVRHIAMNFEHVKRCAREGSVGASMPGVVDFGPFFTWMRRIKAPVTLFVAKSGLLSTNDHGDWNDMGLRRALPNSTVIEVPAGHFESLRCPELAEHLHQLFAVSAGGSA